MTHTRLARFMLPLVITAMVLELGSQVLNGGMARVPQATTTLAAYGLAWALLLFLSAPLAQSKELGLVLINDRAALRAVRRFVVLAGFLLMAATASLTLTPLGDVVIERLHGIDPELGGVVRVALFWLTPYPMIRGLILFHAGLLMRVRRTTLVSYAILSNLAISILTVFGLVGLPWIHAQPIRLPIVVVYIGHLTELGILLWGTARYVLPQLPADDPAGELPPSHMSILRFFWPLALIMIIQEMSRPVINLFVARGPNATEALAVLAVVYTLGRIPYGWLNEIRNLAPAFRDEPNTRVLRRFALGCGLVSLAMMGILFWTPLRPVILRDWIGMSPDLVSLAATPLHLFTGFSVAVTLRAYFHGVGLVEHRTQAMAPSAPARITAIVLSLLLLPLLDVTGATLGIAALLAGFVVEAITVWWGVRGRQWWQARAAMRAPDRGPDRSPEEFKM